MGIRPSCALPLPLPRHRPPSLVVRRHLVVDVADERYPHLRRVVATKHVAGEVRLHLHVHLCPRQPAVLCACLPQTYHFQCAPQHADEYVGEPQLVLRPAVVGQLDKVGERVLLEDQRELLVVARPVGDGRCDVQEDLEADLVSSLSWAPRSRRGQGYL